MYFFLVCSELLSFGQQSSSLEALVCVNIAWQHCRAGHHRQRCTEKLALKFQLVIGKLFYALPINVLSDDKFSLAETKFGTATLRK